ncbi:MAG: PIG-L family deacetylase [Vicinamibacterales bacterium]
MRRVSAMKCRLASTVALVCVGLALPLAQMRVVPVDMQQGHVALGLALRQLGNAGTFMMATAHPDDENNGLLVKLNRGEGFRTALATATRGNGGQNEIGPEIFEALGVLRTEELAALHRFDGAEQYFTRAVDFGFSFSVDETFEKWGREEIVGDFVRLIRTVRPDVIAGLSPFGTGGGQHHQASAILAREAYLQAGDPTKYPEQVREGLRPWQPKKFYFAAQFGGPRDPNALLPSHQLTIDLSGYDTLLGRTYTEIGTEARSMHKCQGMAQLLSLPGPASTTYYLKESTIAGQQERDERGMFDGVDTSITGLAKFAGADAPRALTDGLAAIAAAVDRARRAFDADDDAAVLAPLVDGLTHVRRLRTQLPALASIGDQGRFEIDFRLARKESQFQEAVLLANNIRIEVLADDGIVVPAQALHTSVIVANRGAASVEVTRVVFEGFDAAGACALTAVTSSGGFGGPPSRPVGGAVDLPMSVVPTGKAAQCTPAMRVPSGARPSEPYWHRAGEAGRYTFDADAPFGLPYRPTPFRVQLAMTIGAGASAVDVVQSVPVEFRYQGNIFSGEKRSELLVVPGASVRVSPEIAIIPAANAAALTASGRAGSGSGEMREIRVTVVNDEKGAASRHVRLAAPAGWNVAPADVTIDFAREGESQTVRFQVTPSAGTAAGEYRVKAVVTSGEREFRRGYQVIEYPHIRRQHIYREAETTLKVIDVRTPAGLRVGYVMGVGDEVPAALEQLGVSVEMLGPDELAWGDLSRFQTIVTGVRAYERRPDLRANNSRLLEFVRNGGTLVVQYNKFEFNDAQYGPYPAKVSSERVTDEFAPVTPLAPASPVFNSPNTIGEGAWKNWVQERGLYFLGERDSRYQDLLSLDEPFPFNKGEKRGALVEAQYGKGRWIYVGLGLWRELPAGVDGAYLLLANLITPPA